VSRQTIGAARKAPPHWYRAFLAPLVVVLALVGVLPLLYTAFLSVSRSPSGSLVDRRFDGFGAYSSLFADPSFWNAALVQVIFVIGAVVIEMVLGVLIALALNRQSRFMTFARSFLLAPTVLPTVVVALLFSYLLQSRVGAISYLAGQLGLPSDWQGSGVTALAMLIGIDAWQFTPLVAVLVLAGLQAVPTELIEAGVVDGAGPIRRTISIVLPFVAPVLITVGLLRLIDAVQVFPTIYVLTGGGPGESTNALNYFAFTVFFQFRDTTEGAAIAVILTLATVVAASGLAIAIRRQFK
jgi:multiple sugar transport system permease protein